MACCCSPSQASTARQFNARRARRELAAYHQRGPGPTTRRLLKGLRAVGADRGTVIDIGSGVGVLTFSLLAAGFGSASCVDMSPAAIAVARSEAERQACIDRIRWIEADFVSVAAELPPADLVALDRVVCCYPRYEPLLEKAAGRSRRFLALSYPRDRGLVRAVVALENAARRLLRNEFRAFVHPAAAMAALLQRQGYRRIHQELTFAWSADIYVREAA